MTGGLLHTRCFHHGAREAVARCIDCRRFYCRECITEHDGRMLCSNCLGATAAVVKPANNRFWLALWWGGALFGIFSGWLLFLAFGRFLELLHG